jgi:Leucine-rich repeat (LRR) protein
MMTHLPQSRAANCTYAVSHDNHKYTCTLKDAQVLTPQSPLTLDGNHLDGFTDANVQAVSITHSTVRFIQGTIFEKFPNLEEFSIHDGDVQQILPTALDSCDKLELFHIENASLSEIPSKIFQKCAQLREINLISCQISTVASDAFYGVDNALHGLDLSRNLLVSLSHDTLSGLIRLRQLNLAENEIKSVDESAFNELAEVESLVIYGNAIGSVRIFYLF